MRLTRRLMVGLLVGLGALVLVFGFTADALAQGVQTATLSGVVKSPDGVGVPGVAVTLTSPAMQGERLVVTDANGGYIFRGLPPGVYKMKMELAGFATAERNVTLAIGDSPVLADTMTVATLQETITVTGEAPSILNETVVGQKIRAEQVDKLATARTLAGIANLSPGLTNNTPNAGQVTISGAFAYDTVYLLNGVDINDNLFGSPHNLFIEDALEEVQTLTSGISAEYGRFSGGVINAVTKRGSNRFSGSFRTDFTNPSWQDENQFEKTRTPPVEHTDLTTKIYQATLGGPIIRDRVWFFGAYRRQMSTESRTLTNTGIGYDFEVENPRYEGKITATVVKNHTIQAAYSRNNTVQNNNASINTTASIDLRTLVNRQLPNDLFVADYNGVLTSNLFVEARYSQKVFGFRNSGGTSLNILDSPFMSRGLTGIPSGRHYNAPYFDSNDPEDRNNHQYAAALSYFLSTGNTGRHDFKAGFERYTSTRTGGNNQSSTGYVFLTDPVVVAGQVRFDANDRIIPTFVPNVSQVQAWFPTKGAQLDIHTNSFYVNDRWQLSNRWSFNLGVRAQFVKSEATGDIVGADHKALLPRLGVTFDTKGDGSLMLYGTYAHYAGKFSERQFGSNTPVGSPSRVTYGYTGPAGQGLDFAPGFSLANYTRVISGNFPTANVFFEDLHSPLTKEFTVAAGRRLGNRGEAKLTYVHRNTASFIEDFLTIDGGKTTVVRDGVTFGTFDNRVIRNSDEPVRKYQGLVVQGRYRINDWWNVQAHWTLQIKNEGNFEGEAANQPGNSSLFGDYPEIYVLARNEPYGRVDDFQRHKVRAFSFWDIRLGGAGTASFGGTYSYDSPLTYSLFQSNFPINAIQRSRNPGYANVPTTQTLYFGERGSRSFESAHIFDLALNYDIPVYRTLSPWFKLELRNMFNTQPLIAFDRTISANATGSLDADGLPTTYTQGPNFGKGTQSSHYPVPREFRFSVGIRF